MVWLTARFGVGRTSMNQKSERIIRRYTVISRRVFYSLCLAIFLAWLYAEVSTALGLKGNFLETIDIVFIAFGALMLVISWTTPGILIFLGKPWLAHAWLRGINPIAVSSIPWDQLPSGRRLLTYFWSLLLLGFTILAILVMLIQAIQR
jgi:hypothetical protein